MEEEKESLKDRVKEYEYINGINKNIIQELEQKLVDFYNLQNKLNDKVVELQITRSINKDLNEKIVLLDNNETNLKQELNKCIQFKYKFEEAENKNTNLQLQLADAIMQLNEQAKNVLFLKEQVSRMALLECLLVDAKQELAEWKMLAEIKKHNSIN